MCFICSRLSWCTLDVLGVCVICGRNMCMFCGLVVIACERLCEDLERVICFWFYSVGSCFGIVHFFNIMVRGCV